MTIRPLFAWPNLWVGFYWDRKARSLTFFPIPMFGFVFSFGHRCAWCERSGAILELADGRHACSEDHYIALLGADHSNR